MHRRRFKILLLYIACAMPFVVTGAVRALTTNANSPVDWVSNEFPAKQDYEAFRKQFGAGDVVVISWPGCTLGCSQLDDLVGYLRTGRGFCDDQLLPWIERVVCGREEFRRLTSPPISLPTQTALSRLSGVLVGHDGDQTCIVVTLNTEGLAKRALIVPRLRTVVGQFCQVPVNDIHMAGPVMDGLTVDQASKQALDRFAPMSSLVILWLCWICLDSVPTAVLVFGVSLLCQAVTLAIISWCGDTMSALLIVMPPLIQVLAVAGGIHLANYYFDECRREGLDGAAERAFRVGWLPCTLSAGTTAIGLASLLVSRLLPVRAFGGYAAAGVCITLAVLLAVVPGALFSWRPRPPRTDNRSIVWLGWDRVVHAIAQRHAVISLTAILGMVAAAIGTTRLQTSVRIETLFGSESRLIADYRWLESHLGPLVPIEAVVTCDMNCHLAFEDRLNLVARVQQTLDQNPRIAATTSAIDFLPAVPPSVGDTPMQQIAMADWLQGARLALFEANYFLTEPTDSSESYRVTGFTSALEEVDYGLFLEEIREQVEPLLRANGQTVDGVDVRLTGIMPLVHEIQRQLLEDLFASFLTAFLVITVVMTLVQAGILAGLVAMIPNVFPTMLVFGLLGWRAYAIDIGSVMTASIALGIAVDDTLHFLTFFRRRTSEGATREDAVRFACRHCGRAMMQTTLICGVGLLAFALSDFVPTVRFAWMMFALLLVAIVGDLIVLPALLLGPAGRLFVELPRPTVEGANEVRQVSPEKTRTPQPPHIANAVARRVAERAAGEHQSHFGIDGRRRTRTEQKSHDDSR